jgi:hypothetical protein
MQSSMFRMSALIQQRQVRLFARVNRYQHCAIRMLLAKVITKSALSGMNCLHGSLLLISHESRISQCTVASNVAM